MTYTDGGVISDYTDTALISIPFLVVVAIFALYFLTIVV